MDLRLLISSLFILIFLTSCQVKQGSNEAGGLFEGHQKAPVSVTIDFPYPINIANSTNYSIAGSCSKNGEDVTLVINALTFTETCDEKRYEFSALDLSSLSDSLDVALNVTHSTKFISRSVVKDTVPPTLVSTFISPGTKSVGETMFVQVSYDEEVTYLLSPRIGLTFESMSVPSPFATVITGAGYSTLNFLYTILPGDGDANGITLASTIDLNGGGITDLVGNPAPVTLTTTSFPAVLIGGSFPLPAIALASPVDNSYINIATDSSAFFVSGSCDVPGATVSINVNSAPASGPAGLICDGSNFVGSIDSTVLAEGSHVLTAIVSGPGGTATSSAITVVKDITTPTLSLNPPSDVGSTNSTNYSLSGNCSEEGQLVSISFGSLVTSGACSSGSWSVTGWDVSSLADSPGINITVDLTDLAGNPAIQQLASVAKDTAAPTIAVTSPADNSFINTLSNSTTFAVSGTCSEATMIVAIKFDGVPALSPAGFICDGSNFSGTVDVTGLAESAHTLTAEITDPSSNTTVSAPHTVTKDITAPTLTLTTPPDISGSNVLSYALSGTCSENGRMVSVAIGALSSSASCTSGSWSITNWDVSSLTDAPALSITVDHSDLAGNPAIQQLASVLKDTNGPTISISSPTASSFINIAGNIPTFPVSGLCSEATATVTVKIDGSPAVSPSGFTCDGTNFSGTIDVTSLTEGSLSFVAEITDAGSNTTASAAVLVTKDITVPTVALGTLASVNSSNVAAYSLSGTCSENGQSVDITIGALSQTVTCSANAWTVSSWDLTAISDSPTVPVSADHSDAAGNPAVQATGTIIKDLTPPTLAITTPIDGSYINVTSNTASFAVSGTCSENGEIVTIKIDGSPAAGPSGFACDGTNFSGTIDVTSLPEGSRNFTASISDAGGNPGSSSVVTVTKDITPPTLAFDALTDIVTANMASYSVTGTCGPEVTTIALSVAAANLSPTCSGGVFSATVDASSFADGNISLTASAPDLAGNTGLANLIVVKDTTAPVLSITFSPAINTGNQGNYQFFGSCSENGLPVSATIGGLNFSPNCSGGSWSVGPTDVSAAPDSLSLPISVSQTDSHGYTGSASTTIVKNTSSITVAITTAPDITKTNNTSYQISGSCSQNGVLVSISIGGISRSPFCSGGSWSTGFVDVSSLADGSVTITADHATALQASVSVTKDTLSPTITISSAPNINTNNESSYKVTGTCSQNGSSVSIWIDSLNINKTCTSGAWSTGFVNVSSVPDGAAILITADHSTAPQASRTVSKATSTPSVASLSVPITLDTSVNLDWDLIDPGGFTINDYIVEYRLKGQSTWLSASDGVSTNTYGTASGLSPGTTYEFRVAVLYNTSLQSGWSSTVEGETKPSSPIIGANVAMNVGGAVDSTVVAYEDSTNVTLNGSPLVTLNKGQTHRFTSSQFDLIDADKPIFTAGRKGSGAATATGNIVWQPTAWAGKIFSFNADRESFQRVDVYALENTTVEVYKGTTLLDTITLTAGGSGTLNWAPLGSYQIQATGTILAYHISTDNGSRIVDPKPLLPNALEIIGFPSKDMNLSTDTNATNYTAIHSNSTTINNSIDKNQVITLGPQGTSSLYQTESLLITADQKIFGASYADSNGNCSAPFLPTNLMKKKFAIPVSGDYIAFASKMPGTIEVRNSSNGLVTTLTLTRSGASPSAPYKARLTNPVQGHRYISTVPMAAWYQPNSDVGGANQDETIMYGSN